MHIWYYNILQALYMEQCSFLKGIGYAFLSFFFAACLLDKNKKKELDIALYHIYTNRIRWTKKVESKSLPCLDKQIEQYYMLTPMRWQSIERRCQQPSFGLPVGPDPHVSDLSVGRSTADSRMQDLPSTASRATASRAV